MPSVTTALLKRWVFSSLRTYHSTRKFVGLESKPRLLPSLIWTKSTHFSIPSIPSTPNDLTPKKKKSINCQETRKYELLLRISVHHSLLHSAPFKICECFDLQLPRWSRWTKARLDISNHNETTNNFHNTVLLLKSGIQQCGIHWARIRTYKNIQSVSDHPDTRMQAPGCAEALSAQSWKSNRNEMRRLDISKPIFEAFIRERVPHLFIWRRKKNNTVGTLCTHRKREQCGPEILYN